MLRHMRVHLSTDAGPKVVRYHFEHTSYWDELWRSSSCVVAEELSAENNISLEPLFKEVRLDGEWKRTCEGALLRYFSVREAQSQGFSITPEQLENAGMSFRVANGLQNPEAFKQWLERNNFTRMEFLQFLEDEIRNSWVRAMFGVDMTSRLPDYLKSAGLYEHFTSKARAKADAFALRGISDLSVSKTGLTIEELYSWYFSERLGIAVPNNLDAKAKDMGFADEMDLKRAVVGEWLFLKESAPDQSTERVLSRSCGNITKLEPGDPAPEFTLKSSELGPVKLEKVIGRTLLLFIHYRMASILLNTLETITREQKLKIVWITRDVVDDQILPMPAPITLLDIDERVYHRYNIEEPTAFLLDSAHRIEAIISLADEQCRHETLLREIDSRRPVPQSIGAPVLVIPKVLPPKLCNQLIECWHSGGNQIVGVHRLTESGPKDMLDSQVKRRRDHFLGSGDLDAMVRHYIERRVNPELLKVFYFQPRQCERLRIACYESAEEGFFRAHRDNRSDETARRRFSMSINLNSDAFEGGEVKFPEYGEAGFRPDSGSALVFSSSLLHEATVVTKGRRFALITFLLADESLT